LGDGGIARFLHFAATEQDMMPCRRIPVVTLASSAAFLAIGGACASIQAQGVTTAAIEGQVTLGDAGSADGARVRASNPATGYTFETIVRSGRFAILGLEVGGPYSVVVRKIGYRAEGRDRIYLSLGQRLELALMLERVAIPMDTVRVLAAERTRIPLGTGVGKLISDSALRRLPTIDRDMYDFVRLTPQIVASGAGTGLSGGGVSTRFNSFLLDGVSERGLVGNFAAGTGQGGKAISIEAVKEYQVLLTPYDVRYGDFAGALVNAVTRSGSNQLGGSVFAYGRNSGLARETPFLRDASYKRAQFGFTLGGPLVPSRARFFIASEFQRLTSPAAGPYVGQAASREVPVPASVADIAAFKAALEGYGLEPGSGAAMNVGNPLRNVFVRVDIAFPERRSRLVVWNNYSLVENIVFSRQGSTSFFTRGALTFPLSSYRYTSSVTKDVAAARFFTSLQNGGVNEFMLAFKLQPSAIIPDSRATLVSVAVPRADATGNVFLESGSNEAAHGITVSQKSFEIADDLTFVMGPKHRLALGARAEAFGIVGRGLPGAYGSWLFSSLDSLLSGRAERFRLVTEPAGARSAKPGVQLGLYAGDEWKIHERLSVTAGIRADAVVQSDPAPYNPTVDSLFGRRTSDMRRARIQWSPRIGFAWAATADQRSHVRGGIGLFIGRPPLGWLNASLRNDGAARGTLQCGAGGSGPAPAFEPNYLSQPHSCANGSGLGAGAGGPLDFEDRNLRLAETLRASLSYERLLSRSLTWKMEGLATRNRADFLFVNMNLAGPAALDRHGRVLYGVVDTTGRATPTLIAGRFSEVIDLRNQSRNKSFQLTTELEQRYSEEAGVSLFYSYSRVRDVQTPPAGFSANDNWQGGRVVSGLHSETRPSISALDIPHRVGLSGTYSFGKEQWRTDVSLYYVGESGAPFTYIASAGRGRGDLNADGTNLNDPIYIPLNAADTSEIAFTGSAAERLAQQSAIEALIAGSGCLRSQRGRIMARNSCRAPWINLANMSIRQKLPPLGGHPVTVQLDVFNLLNLLNAEWGELRVVTPGPNASLLEQVGQTAGTAAQSQPTFRLNRAATRFDADNVQSAYQLQLGIRYSF
jgi:hypothetical protein